MNPRYPPIPEDKPPVNGPFTKLDGRAEVHAKWIQLLEQRLQEARVSNDSSGLDAIQTARLRGRIAEINDLLGMARAGL